MTKKTQGASLPVTETYTTLLANTITVGNARQLAALDGFTTIIQSSHNNQGTVYVGNQAGQYFELQSGESVVLPCAPRLVWIRGSDANQIVRWLVGA